MIIAGRCFRVGQERASIEDVSRERRIRSYVTIRDSPLSLSSGASSGFVTNK